MSKLSPRSPRSALVPDRDWEKEFDNFWATLEAETELREIQREAELAQIHCDSATFEREAAFTELELSRWESESPATAPQTR